MSAPIKKQLQQSFEFNEVFDVHIINLYDYLDGYKFENEVDIIDEHVRMLRSANVLVLQSLRSDRDFLNKDNILRKVRKKCKIICIPQYTFSGYHPKLNIPSNENITFDKSFSELKEYVYTELFLNDREKVISNLESELKHISELDKISNIKCHDFIKNNYNKRLLFNNRQYGTHYFFHYIAQEILNIININDTIGCAYDNFGKEYLQPIYPNVSKYLGLKFSHSIIFNQGCNLIEYIVCCKKIGVNSLYLKQRDDGIHHCEEINRIIKSGIYR